MNIPYNKLYLTGKELLYIKEALEDGNIAGDGVFDPRVCDFLERRLPGTSVRSVTSGTHALELAVALAQIQPGDEVIMPSYTFPSTANAVMLRGGIPVFCDVDEETLCMDLEDVEKRITGKTKMLMPVHYGGVCCPMDRLVDLARDRGLVVVEDAAQALGSTYKEKPLGTWGEMGCFSFHGTKNLVSGEGGAISIRKPNEDLLEKAEIYRQKGTNRIQFIKGEVSQYTWVGEGSSYAPSDLLMAVLYAQLEEMDQIHKRRSSIYHGYQQQIRPMVERGLLRGMSTIPNNVTSNYHNFYVLFHDGSTRDRVRQRLQEQGIGAVIHFVPLHVSPMGAKLGYAPEDLPITKMAGDCLLRLPLYTAMTMEEMMQVSKALLEALEHEYDR